MIGRRSLVSYDPCHSVQLAVQVPSPSAGPIEEGRRAIEIGDRRLGTPIPAAVVKFRGQA